MILGFKIVDVCWLVCKLFIFFLELFKYGILCKEWRRFEVVNICLFIEEVWWE